MTNKQKRSLILAHTIGTLLSCYTKEEKTRLHNELQAGLNKGMKKQVSLHSLDVVKFVAQEQGDNIFSSAVEHFKKDKISIEASSTILFIWGLDEKYLAKHYGLSRAKLEKWGKVSRRDDAKEHEDNGRKVGRFIDNAIHELYGIPVEEKMSIMDMIELAKEKRK